MTERGKNGLVLLFWLAVWSVAALVVANPLFLPAPWTVLEAMMATVQEPSFLLRLFFSQVHVLGGLLVGAFLGSLLGWQSATHPLLYRFCRIPVLLMRAVPVASFILFALFLMPSAHLAFFIVFLLVLPPVFENARVGRLSVDHDLEEMADTFHVTPALRFRGLLLPTVSPYLTAAFHNAIGLAWKGGAAAEMIALSTNTLGEALFQSKLTLEMPLLFAWTGWILLLSAFHTKALLFLWKKAVHAVCRIGVQKAAPRATSQQSEGPLLRWTDVSVAYGEQTILNRVSGRIAIGDRIVLTGPSGRGKTTLLRLLSGLEQGACGNVYENETSRRQEHRYENGDTALRFAILFQEDRLLPQHTVRENLRFVGISEEAIAEGLEALELSDAGDKPAMQLSGGMKRRVALLRTVLWPGDILILDEPGTGMDAILREKTLRYAERKSHHFLAMVVADHLPEDGKWLAVDTSWALLADGKLQTTLNEEGASIVQAMDSYDKMQDEEFR